jgi:hypothetical protein
VCVCLIKSIKIHKKERLDRNARKTYFLVWPLFFNNVTGFQNKKEKDLTVTRLFSNYYLIKIVNFSYDM